VIEEIVAEEEVEPEVEAEPEPLVRDSGQVEGVPGEPGGSPGERADPESQPEA
jgi:hypothetical protein